MRWPTPSSIAAAAGSAIIFSTASHSPTLAVEPPSTEALTTLRKAYQAATDGLLTNADTLLTKSVAEWKRTAQPADELAALYKVRGTVRQEQGRTTDAVGDLDEALALLTSPSSAKPVPSEVQRTYLLRARLNAALQRWKEAEVDFSAAIARLDELDAIEATNPYLYSERSIVRSHLGDWAGAADDALTASVEFKDIGDKLRSLLASSDASLALYGAGDIDEALSRMRSTFTSYGAKSPTSNNPDDIGTLQALARREAEMHLAYAAHVYGADGLRDEAQQQWLTGCIRLESFVTDAEQRQAAEASLRAQEAMQAEATGKEVAGTLRASSVAGSFSNTAAIAMLNGLDPKSPFVTQRPQSGFAWYSYGEGASARRNPGVPLATVEPGLSCAKYRQADWLRANRPEWPPALVANVEKFAAAVPQGPILVPKKGSGLDRTQCSVLLSKPGLGDAVPCFQ